VILILTIDNVNREKVYIKKGEKYEYFNECYKWNNAY
jgi:hypothetical protein